MDSRTSLKSEHHQLIMYNLDTNIQYTADIIFSLGLFSVPCVFNITQLHLP